MSFCGLHQRIMLTFTLNSSWLACSLISIRLSFFRLPSLCSQLKSETFSSRLFGAFFAGTVESYLIVIPCELLKVRHMTQAGHAPFFDVMKQIIKTEGMFPPIEFCVIRLSSVFVEPYTQFLPFSFVYLES